MAIGISGGMVPCPSALVLLLSAMAEGRSLTIALHQMSYGLELVGVLSLGLASVLAACAVYARQWLEEASLAAGLMQRLSVASAIVTVCVGVGVATVAISG